jgi:Fur family ferric uptake transcriptional regulator
VPKAEASDKLARFHEFIKQRSLKSTRQRDEIASWFFTVKGHLSADAIYSEVKHMNPGIGVSTVYRTLDSLCILACEQYTSLKEEIRRYKADHPVASR